MASRVTPPLLQPYLSPSSAPPKSLALVTSVLGASANWLVLRYLVSFLSQAQSTPTLSPFAPTTTAPAAAPSSPGKKGARSAVVVLLSFLRDVSFWTSASARLGLDLAAAGRKGRFVFVDGMGDDGGLLLLARSDPAKSTTMTTREKKKKKPAAAADPIWHVRLEDTFLRREQEEDMGHAVSKIIEQVRSRISQGEGEGKEGGGDEDVILIVDGLDFLQAATEEKSSVVEGWAMRWREETSSLVLTLHADDPLIHTQTTNLEKHHASLVLSLAHSADLVLACRMLDTGGASDVSGVIRITPRAGGPGASEFDEPEGPSVQAEEMQEQELLYFINSDGSAKVFERGS